MEETKPLKDADEYKVIRGQIEHVDNNLSQRVIWLVIAQSFFFSAYAILINGKPALPELEAVHRILTDILPIAALLTVLFTSIDVLNSMRYMRDLRKFYEKTLQEEDGSARAYPPIQGIPRQRILMHASPVLIPCMFTITWIIIIAVHFTHAAPPPQ